ncbi:MAG: hypothetical protein CRU78_04570 [Candidatus Accumulibacter phosphatis]|jgi:FkbM family methyltransferase|uniref:Methyltransferase FkbM domain-containing protein n=1 Tax=Candidatus Accumulibacter phosphatis TaxID=327160 RepID=A0A6A7RQK4_9PROT|nr:hypothetical protein [Candidatus Accumulibacter phosphatis]
MSKSSTSPSADALAKKKGGQRRQKHQKGKKSKKISGGEQLAPPPLAVPANHPVSVSRSSTDQAIAGEPEFVPYDEELLERTRTQWQFGDWSSLCQLAREDLRHHPDRAKLALLVAAGHLQTENPGFARQYLRLAKDWGCSNDLITQILVAGVHNSLGRAHMADRQDQRALGHFEDAIRVAMPQADAKLFGEARAVREAARMGLLPQAARLMDAQLAAIKKKSANDSARVTILATEIELLHHELSLAQQRQQLHNQSAAASAFEEEEGSVEWRERLKHRSVSQLGQDLWVLEKTRYKRGGFFVEIGATDGVLLSNTLLLESEFGWQGICAEPNPKFYTQLRKNRQCRVADQFVGRVTGKDIEFILADVYGGDREFANGDLHKEKRDAYAAVGQLAKLTSISLDDFLQQHQAPRDIDYISIDTEGSEYDILRAFPFEKWNTRLFTIEHNFAEQREDIRQLLEAHGYRRTEQQWDDWYEKPGDDSC